MGNRPLIRTQTSSDQRRAYLHLPFDLHLLVYFKNGNDEMLTCGFALAFSRQCHDGEVLGQLSLGMAIGSMVHGKYIRRPHEGFFVKGAEIR